MKKLLLIISIILLLAGLGFAVAHADSISSTIQQVGEKSTLPSFDAGHEDQAYQAGASNITSAIYFTVDFLKYILGAIATIVIIVSGIQLVVASQNNVDETLKKAKKTLSYAVIGLFLIIIADQVVKGVFFGEEGEIYRSGQDLQAAAEEGSSILMGIIGIMRVIIPSVAVLFIVITGFRLVTSMGDAEAGNKAKKQLTWAIVGLIIAGLAELIVFRIVFPDQGTRLSDPYEFNRLVITMTNFISGFIATLAVSFLIYAGYLYVIAGVDENLNQKAKKVALGAVIGLLVTMAAFALVNTFVKVEPLQDTEIVSEDTINLNTGP